MKDLLKKTWNYNPNSITSNFAGLQRDWNQTLVTKFNQIHAERSEFTLERTMKVPVKFKPILESLFFYNNGEYPNAEEHPNIDHRFGVEYIDSDSNVIEFMGEELEILNFGN